MMSSYVHWRRTILCFAERPITPIYGWNVYQYQNQQLPSTGLAPIAIVCTTSLIAVPFVVANLQFHQLMTTTTTYSQVGAMTTYSRVEAK